MDYMIRWDFQNSVMPQYFRLSQKGYVKCKTCDFQLQRKMDLLEYHILFKHPEIIEEIRNEIRRMNLVKYFMFDVGLTKIRCVVCNIFINVFWGVVGLKQHLLSRHRITYWYK